jgi:deazaflavin-dependent oxidoreductase (nitroreductase family)
MRLHKAVYIRTDGRVGHGMLVVVPSLLLRTTGRRSGGQRTTALSYARDGEDYLLVASNNAKDQSPGWYFNICANPQVGIQVRREHLPGVARAVHKGDPDYARLWRLANDNNSGRYDAYQRRTDRAIPLVVVRAT